MPDSHPKDTLDAAEARLRQMLSIGFTPTAMLWRPETPSQEKWAPDEWWRAFHRRWARPAIIHAREVPRPPKTVILMRKILDADRRNRRPPGRTKTVYNAERDVHGSRTAGNSAAAALRRLERRRPDLLDRVLAGELSAHAAMIEAGFRKCSERQTLVVKPSILDHPRLRPRAAAVQRRPRAP